VTDEEIAALQDELTEAQTEVDRLQTIAADREARAAHLEETLAGLREEQGRLSASLSEAQVQFAARDEDLAAVRQELAALQASLKAAASKYRDALLASRPEVPPDLVSGETVEEVDQQLEGALRMVAQLRTHLESQAQTQRVPTGAPARRAADLSALSPAEKIVHGLSQQQR
jgi:septal ring factor EnvC (AmiA/AmiB activator)